MKAARCCRSCTTSPPEPASPSTPPTTARRISPTASARSRRPAPRSIADDIGYFDEPFFQDGILAQAIDAVEAQGVAYFSAAGNDGAALVREHDAELRHRLEQRSERRRKSTEFRRRGATTTTALPVTIAAAVPRRIRRAGRGMGPAVRDRRARQWPGEQSDRSVRHGRVRPTRSIEPRRQRRHLHRRRMRSAPIRCRSSSSATPPTPAPTPPPEQVNCVIGLVNGSPTAPGGSSWWWRTTAPAAPSTPSTPQSPTCRVTQRLPERRRGRGLLRRRRPRCGTSPAVLERYSSAGR